MNVMLSLVLILVAVIGCRSIPTPCADDDERRMYEQAFRYIENDSNASAVLSLPRPVKMRVLDTIPCSGGLPIGLDDVAAFALSKDGISYLERDSLYEIVRNCVPRRDRAVASLSTTEDNYGVVIFTSDYKLGSYTVLPVMLIRDFSVEKDKWRYDACIIYVFVFDSQFVLRKVFQDTADLEPYGD